MDCSLWVGSELLPQVKEFKHLGVLFANEGKMEREMDRRIAAAAAVMKALYWTIAKLSIYQLIYVSAFTYGHELWIVTKRTRLWIQAAEMCLLSRVVGLSLREG